MKSLVAVILLICLTLPVSAWERVLGNTPCLPAALPGVCAVAHDSCSCCPKGHCPCMESGDEEPSRPVPAVPPRSLERGDPVLVLVWPDVAVHRVWCPVAKQGPSPAWPSLASRGP